MARAHAPRRRAMNDVLLDLLVSDGVATVGQTSAQALGGLARGAFDDAGVLTTSVGLGTDFDEAAATEGLKASLARAAGSADFAALKDRLLATAQGVLEVYEHLIESPAAEARARLEVDDTAESDP